MHTHVSTLCVCVCMCVYVQQSYAVGRISCVCMSMTAWNIFWVECILLLTEFKHLQCGLLYVQQAVQTAYFSKYDTEVPRPAMKIFLLSSNGASRLYYSWSCSGTGCVLQRLFQFLYYDSYTVISISGSASVRLLRLRVRLENAFSAADCRMTATAEQLCIAAPAVLWKCISVCTGVCVLSNSSYQ